MKKPDDDSVIHVRVPYELHMTVKVRAMESGMSMNDYVTRRLQDATGRIVQFSQGEAEKRVMDAAINLGQSIERHKTKTPDKRGHDGSVTTKPRPQVMNILEVETDENGHATSHNIRPTIDRLQNGVCKIHGTPLTSNRKCLQKGCKNA